MKKSSNPYLIRSNQKDIHENLEKIVTKHLNNEFMRPIPEHQIEIFNIIDDMVMVAQKPIILDSGCGTGLSTQNLAKQFPDHLVIGVDRSLHRLNKADTKEPINQHTGSPHPNLPPKGKEWFLRKNNLILVQANLIDFWNLIYQKNQSYLDNPNKPNPNKSNSNKSNSNKKWNITHHFILYPNPYPKAAQFKQRFHGHPIFPIMLKISPRLEIRTNWDIYIKEAYQTIKICNKDLDNNLKINIENINNDFNNKNSHPISLFEDKYLKNNIKIYKLNFIKKPLKQSFNKDPPYFKYNNLHKFDN